MDKIVCPNCQHSIRTQTVIVTEPAPANARTRPLRAFLNTLAPGRISVADLDRAYEGWRGSPDGTGAPAISRRTLAYEFERMGVQRYRTATERGFVIAPTEEPMP
jgi:hypothetical protein